MNSSRVVDGPSAIAEGVCWAGEEGPFWAALVRSCLESLRIEPHYSVIVQRCARLARTSIVEGRLEKLPLADASVDYLYSICVFNRATHPVRAEREIRRASKSTAEMDFWFPRINTGPRHSQKLPDPSAHALIFRPDGTWRSERHSSIGESLNGCSRSYPVLGCRSSRRRPRSTGLWKPIYPALWDSRRMLPRWRRRTASRSEPNSGRSRALRMNGAFLTGEGRSTFGIGVLPIATSKYPVGSTWR